MTHCRDRRNSDRVIVTRHATLVRYLIDTGLAKSSDPVIRRVTHPDQICGKHVVGVLPIDLAAHACKFTEVKLSVPEVLRGQELDYEQVCKYARSPIVYWVREIGKNVVWEGMTGLAPFGHSRMQSPFFPSFGVSLPSSRRALQSCSLTSISAAVRHRSRWHSSTWAWVREAWEAGMEREVFLPSR